MSDVDYSSHVDSEYYQEIDDILAEVPIVAEMMRNGQKQAEVAHQKLMRGLENARAAGRHAGLALIDLTVHRLYDYLMDYRQLTEGEVSDIEVFTDVCRAVLSGEIGDSVDTAEFVRSLPVRKPQDVDLGSAKYNISAEDLAHLDIEIMFVEPKRSLARIVERELLNCGYRVINVRHAAEALSLAVQTKPDMVMASIELDELTGVDLACAFASMPSARGIPFAVLTSRSKDDPALGELPMSTVIIRKGGAFAEDMARALQHFAIA